MIKNIFDAIKIALLIVIVFILKDSVYGNNAKTRENDLKDAVEYNIAKYFDRVGEVVFFGESLQFSQVFNDIGIDVSRDNDLETLTFCGYFSFKDKVRSYTEPFHAIVNVNNKKKGLSGEIWLRNNGEFKRISLYGAKNVFGTEEIVSEQGFRHLFFKSCGDYTKPNLGFYKDYKVDVLGGCLDFGGFCIDANFLLSDIKKLIQMSSNGKERIALRDCSIHDDIDIDCLTGKVCELNKDYFPKPFCDNWKK